ncbi:hypothetical protein DBV05_g5560 [Lasiodiplodia theobromae]|uniref:Uncharacterized protein n=1 Tax=Lasiodiplodia theobromae TaxID=45133 RepID=A0A5N5DE23_9PEZI|nr:hypothetical protein DBV05_g5560 [Lasiodiplodia theobromae]
MTSSSISIYQQHAAKLLSRKSVVLGIPIAAGSIILFLQWRKRKSLKPKPKPKSKQPESERKENKVEETRTNGSNGKATPSAVEEKITSEASAQNGSAAAPAPPPAYSSESYAAVAAVPPLASTAAAPSSSPPPYSPISAKHSQDDSDDQRVTGFAYAKRPRLGRGRSVEKFASYEPLRKASAEKREQEEKLRIKEEDDKAAAAAVAAFSPPAAAAAVPEPGLAPISAPALADEDVPPEAPISAPEPEPEAAPAEADVAPEATFEVKVNGWHHDDEEPLVIEERLRDLRRSSIIATFEITTTSEPANLSPFGSAFDTSRRPSVVTTISAEPVIDEEDEEEDKEAEQTPSFPPRRESVTVETAIEIAEAWSTNGMNGTIHEDDEFPAHGVSTVISGPIPVNSAPQEDYDDDEEWAPEDPVREPASTALAKAMDTEVQGDEESKRTDSPLASKPVVVSAAVGVPAPQSAIVEEIKEVVERAPLAHLPGMGIPNSA